MKLKHLIKSPLFKSALTLLLLFVTKAIVFAQDTASTSANTGISGGDIFETIIIAGYLIGVFVLLPWVIYTNTKEKLGVLEEENNSGYQSDSSLSEEERNKRASLILEEIEKKLTPIEEDGQSLVTITKGSQARFVKKGIDYIQKKLNPTDPEIRSRTKEFISVYNNRTKRVFTGSKWIIGFAAGLGIIFFYQMGFKAFVFIHTLGAVFYVLSSRTPIYILEKRMKLFGGSGIVSAIFGSLLLGSGTKYYKVYSDGTRERDHESEFQGTVVYLFLMAIVGMISGFLAAALGVVNFLLNYMNNALIPGKLDTWYEKNFTAA